jgi:hypothetical protein
MAFGLAFLSTLAIAAACVDSAVTDRPSDEYFPLIFAYPFIPFWWVAKKLWEVRHEF